MQSAPPGASASAAATIASERGVQTIATSTGSLPCAVAPQRSARSSRSGCGSRTQTASTPVACAAAMWSRPLQPAPTTSTASPAAAPALAARRVMVDRDAVADRHALDAGAELDHLAGRLVAEHGGQLAADVE